MDNTVIVFVHLNGAPVPAGRLHMVEDSRYSRAEFDYGRRYLERPDAVAIDPVQLPLTRGHHVTGPDFALFNGLRDAAPDRWGRLLIDMYMTRTEGRPASEAEFLLASQNGTRVGGLQFGPTPEAPGPVLDVQLPDVSSDLGTIEAFQEMVDLYTRGEDVPDALLDHVAPGSDLGGARPKGTVTIGGFPWLVKFGLESDRINMAGAEAGCLDLCEKAGLPTCERMLTEVSGHSALLLRRFDRETSPDNTLHRKHMVSSMTLLGAHEFDRGMNGYADMVNAMRKHGEVRGVGESVYTRMVMNVLTGNTDDHYRNHGFLLSGKGRYALSPVYDVTPSLQVSSSRSLFFHLGESGSGRDATLENAVAAGPSMGVPPERAREVANALSDMVATQWRRVMDERGVSKSDVAMLENSFSEAGKIVPPSNDGPSV